jgi:hypothetical protein
MDHDTAVVIHLGAPFQMKVGRTTGRGEANAPLILAVARKTFQFLRCSNLQKCIWCMFVAFHTRLVLTVYFGDQACVGELRIREYKLSMSNFGLFLDGFVLFVPGVARLCAACIHVNVVPCNAHPQAPVPYTGT